MSIEIIYPHDSLDSKLTATARAIFDELLKLPADAPLVIALCGGRSVVGLLEAVRRESATQSKELLSRLQFFIVDERLVPLSSADSNFGGLKRQLFDVLIGEGFITENQIHSFRGDAENAAAECADYLRELNKYGGRFAVVVLGMGEDGHIAGLFPYHSALAQSGRLFLTLTDSPKPPSGRMTASRELVQSATIGVLLALGEAKRDAWREFINPERIDISECPARIVREMRRCLVVTDLVE